LKSYICTVTKDKKRPTIAYIIFNKEINFDDKFIKEKTKSAYLHNLIHLLDLIFLVLKKINILMKINLRLQKKIWFYII
jgi:hypothetical protein